MLGSELCLENGSSRMLISAISMCSAIRLYLWDTSQGTLASSCILGDDPLPDNLLVNVNFNLVKF